MCTLPRCLDPSVGCHAARWDLGDDVADQGPVGASLGLVSWVDISSYNKNRKLEGESDEVVILEDKVGMMKWEVRFRYSGTTGTHDPSRTTNRISQD